MPALTLSPPPKGSYDLRVTQTGTSSGRPPPPAGRSRSVAEAPERKQPSVGAGPARAGWRKRRPLATLSRTLEREIVVEVIFIASRVCNIRLFRRKLTEMGCQWDSDTTLPEGPWELSIVNAEL